MYEDICVCECKVAMNSSSANLLNVYDQAYTVDHDIVTISKIIVAVFMSLFFVYINCIMFFALSSKSVFYETPRYILFGHMLLNDSVQLLIMTALYALSFTFLSVVRALCSFMVLLVTCTSQNAPLTLALMSMERYIAICLPLRHGTLVTPKSTGIALGIIWFLILLNLITDVMFELITDPSLFLKTTWCTREKLFVARWQYDKAQGVDIVFFVSVTVIILFTYVAIIITARNVSSNKQSAIKAHRTVLLHLIQLALCVNTFLFGTIERTLYMMAGSTNNLFIQLRYLNFLIVMILPRCLSPLIYGLRDDAVRPMFRYYFCYRPNRIKPVVHVA
ncbi:odorant receptor 131-2-like [Trichomycterus rosablanca]|uniref:odorant receptor 131-2-like n=1 Tax=Trichomycterus rosablanca TaxID=2290929 RepID=UPI002F35D623